MSVTAPGLPALIDDLGDLARGIADTDAPDRVASGIVARAVASRAPRRTGYLANSVTPHGPTVEVYAPYAPYVAARHPFVTEGATEAAAAAAAPYADHVDTTLAATIRPRY